MKTTVELPEELLREIKLRAVMENRRIKDVVAEALKRGLSRAPEASVEVSRRVRLPLVECAHPAQAENEMTPERTSEILLAEEADDSR